MLALLLGQLLPQIGPSPGAPAGGPPETVGAPIYLPDSTPSLSGPAAAPSVPTFSPPGTSQSSPLLAPDLAGSSSTPLSHATLTPPVSATTPVTPGVQATDQSLVWTPDQGPPQTGPCPGPPAGGPPSTVGAPILLQGPSPSLCGPLIHPRLLHHRLPTLDRPKSSPARGPRPEGHPCQRTPLFRSYHQYPQFSTSLSPPAAAVTPVPVGVEHIDQMPAQSPDQELPQIGTRSNTSPVSPAAPATLSAGCWLLAAGLEDIDQVRMHPLHRPPEIVGAPVAPPDATNNAPAPSAPPSFSLSPGLVPVGPCPRPPA